MLGSETVRDPSVHEPVRMRLVGGGVDGNEWLTTATGAVLIVLLAALGVTIVRIGQLTWLHLFLGFLLLGPVALKLASTGYRFIRYYTRSPAYVDRGPPPWPLRMIAPFVVATNVIVFATGIVLLFKGPRHPGPWFSVHKVSFIVWIAFTALHALGHLPRLGALLRVPRSAGSGGTSFAGGDGAAGRWIALASAIVAGAVVAIVLIPHFAGWTAPGAFHHHD